MERVATWKEQDRHDLFVETSSRKGMSPAIVEKDFWVCWTLGRLFASEELAPKIMFKGGTSLSKVFGLIERFSEDIDLILDWAELSSEDPFAARSKTKQDAFNKRIVEESRVYISSHLLPEIESLLGDLCSVSGVGDQPDIIHVKYHASFSDDYLRPEVLLEVGPLAQWTPNDSHEIQPYAAEAFPELFEHPRCRVQAVCAERTFWEKATILHHEAHRSADKPVPLRVSRHYYDLARMAERDIRSAALANLDLLQSVVDFKSRFYPQNWARYELARPGTLKLIPPEHVMVEVKRDYDAMKIMIYGEAPSLDRILEVLKDLEDEINALGELPLDRPKAGSS